MTHNAENGGEEVPEAAGVEREITTVGYGEVVALQGQGLGCLAAESQLLEARSPASHRL